MITKMRGSLQSSAVITRSNIVRYYIDNYRNCGRVSITCWMHKDTPYLALTGELWGVFCEYLRENWPRYNGTALYLVSHRHELHPTNLFPNMMEQMTLDTAFTTTSWQSNGAPSFWQNSFDNSSHSSRILPSNDAAPAPKSLKLFKTNLRIGFQSLLQTIPEINPDLRVLYESSTE